MQVGDLVKYGHSSQNGIGIVTYVSHAVDAVTVLWADGTTSNHARAWLIRLEEIKCK